MSTAAIEEYEAVLGRHGTVVDFDISSLDRLGVPVTSCSLVVDGRVRHHGNGYGATSVAARVSGLGELAEGVLSAQRVAALDVDAEQGSRHELVARFGADRVADPRTLCLPAGSPYTEETRLRWLPLERVRTGETVWVPLDFVASEPGELGDRPGLITPVSNGLGAGLDPARPITHGVLEILQRHTNGLRFRALDARSPVIEPGGLPEPVAALVARLAEHGVTPVLKHAATELGVCSTYVTGLDDDLSAPIRLTACGEAAHPSAEVSLTKALLEYANSRARKEFCFGDRSAARAVAPPAYWEGLSDAPGEPRAVAAMTAWTELDPGTLRRLTAPDTTRSVSYDSVLVDSVLVDSGQVAGTPRPDSPEALLAYLLDALADHDVLATTRRDGEVVVAKVVVPGLEVEILSYGRLGEAGVRSLLDADLGLVRIGDTATGEHTARVCLTAEAEERLGGPAWYSYAAADRLVGPLYPLYREPPRHSVAVVPSPSGRAGV